MAWLEFSEWEEVQYINTGKAGAKITDYSGKARRYAYQNGSGRDTGNRLYR